MFDYRLLFVAGLISGISAHSHHDHRELGDDTFSYGPRCGTSDPSPEQQLETARYVEDWIANSLQEDSPRNVILVDIQFHVIENRGVGHLTRTDLDNSLNVLNEAFVDAGFQFVERGEATYNNNGAWFNAGMVSNSERNMKSSLRVGGAETLNVYFSAAGGNLGYATFPNTYNCDPKDDGVVVHHNSIPGGKPPYDEGDTLTHEVGHWLGLYHTFQGGCIAGDQVSDTPAQASPTTGCPNSARDSCRRGSPDPIHNFMDYSDDVCMTEFTQGQINRMHALWSRRTNPGPCNYLCFSPDATTNVQGKGTVAMKDLRVGDKVLTKNGMFQEVYTFSHYHHSKPVRYLQIHTSGGINDNKAPNNNDYHPLEVTDKHLIFIHGQSYPISAINVNAGDFVQTLDGPREVTNITSVTRFGTYNPITTDGTIVVDGVIASTYTLFTKETDATHMTIGGYQFLSIQKLLDITFAPYAAFCMVSRSSSLDLCNRHGEGELPSTVQHMNKFYQFWSRQIGVVKLIILLLYIASFGFASCLVSPWGVLLLTSALTLGVGCWFKKPFQTNHRISKGSKQKKLV